MEGGNAGGGVPQSTQCDGCGEFFGIGWGLYNHQERARCGTCVRQPSGDETDSSDDAYLEAVGSDVDGQEEVDVDDPLAIADYEPFHLQLTMPRCLSDDDPDHECNDDCQCDEFDSDEVDEGDHYLQFAGWGECEITESGRETLRFMSTVMKGKSMSQNKAEDFLRYVFHVWRVVVLVVICCLVVTSCLVVILF